MEKKRFVKCFFGTGYAMFKAGFMDEMNRMRPGPEATKRLQLGSLAAHCLGLAECEEIECL